MRVFHPETGLVERHVLGTDIRAGEKPQLVVPGGCWKVDSLLGEGTGGDEGSGGEEDERWSLYSQVVAPGWEFEDFDMCTREELVKRFSQYPHWETEMSNNFVQ